MTGAARVCDAVVWHDLECGGYRADLPLWLALAAEHGDPVLEIGAGTGRVALALARAGHSVTALDLDGELLDELARRAGEASVEVLAADARAFSCERRFALVIVPMQTLQLLGGAAGRGEFLRCAAAHLLPGGAVAAAIGTELELFDLDDPGCELTVLPDVVERDGHVYFSQPIAVRQEGTQFVLERRRETVSPAGERECAADVIRLDRLSVAELEREAAALGLRPRGVRRIPATEEHVGGELVTLGG